MKFLFCCEFYYPSVGGVQEVMRQIAERLVRWGHDVTVATMQLREETVKEWNGVKIEHFAVSGNFSRGLTGKVEEYRDFVLSFPADAILIKAAQQWTFDALFPILDKVRARKIFIPCGFSGLYEPMYKEYFAILPNILRKFNALIFYANRYRDIDFCREHGLSNLAFVPNGASEIEFAAKAGSSSLRARLGIPEDSFLFSTVGSRSGVKGHRELAEAFALMDTRGRRAALVLNGNPNSRPVAEPEPEPEPLSTFAWLSGVPGAREAVRAVRSGWRFAGRARNFLRREGGYRTVRRIAGTVFHKARRICGQIARMVLGIGEGKDPYANMDPIDKFVCIANEDKLKKAIVVNLPREDVIDLFKETDLFVFASNIEYSPVVLYEAAAAGTPFLTVPVGNSEEIARITGGGMVCPAPKDGYGYTRVRPRVLANAMTDAMLDPDLLENLGETGRKNWEKYFSWDVIAREYEKILLGNTKTIYEFTDEGMLVE